MTATSRGALAGLDSDEGFVLVIERKPHGPAAIGQRAIDAQAHFVGPVSVGDAAMGLAIFPDAIDQMVQLGIERVVIDGSRVGQDGVNRLPIRLLRVELLRPDAVISERSGGAEQIDIERVR